MSIEERVKILEASFLSLNIPPDYSADIKDLRAQLKELKETLVKQIPSIQGLVTTQEVTTLVRATAEALADAIVGGEKDLKKDLYSRVDSTLGKTFEEVQAAKNTAQAFGAFAAEALRQRSGEFAR